MISLALLLTTILSQTLLAQNERSRNEINFLDRTINNTSVCQRRCNGAQIPGGYYCPNWCRHSTSRIIALPLSSLQSLTDRRGYSKRQAEADVDTGASTEDDLGGGLAGLMMSDAASAAPPQLSVIVRSTKRNTLEATLVWNWITEVDLAGDGFKGLFSFTVHWARHTCNFDERYPRCDDPDMYFSQTVWSGTKQCNHTIENLTYNSKYWVEIEYNDVTSSKFWFTTPGCNNPFDQTFKRCLHPSATPLTTLVPGDYDFLIGINVTCLLYDSASFTWMAIIRWKLQDDETSSSSSSSSSSWESTVLIRHPADDGIEVKKTSTDHIELKIKPNEIYEITVKASKGRRDIIYKTLYLNISRDLEHSYESCATTTETADKFPSYFPMGNDVSLHPVAYAFAAAGFVFVAVTVVALVFFNRWRGLRSKLLKKTILSKSNSYKTTPGTAALSCCPKAEQIQMVLRRDDWELDARDVTLGAEVGQGAFGLVMTGYYQNTQVAIKVLKGDVLPSYREELLREIALMKQIGKHSNIVSLIGACTIRDPIALIMEYMPFGNLQSFLQKCRLEGGVLRKNTGTEVEYCPLDELTGTKEVWLLTSTDMISFARQVAVAMEFLTDRKYVHRDLAARNVLVGKNKIVKLCDFGLARLVYNGDQYYKLTNGRLPLKWMSIESIRDRVFTAQTDVWSYGVLLWEVATLGASPYSNVALVDLYRLLNDGYRMEQPKNCSNEIYDIMSQCWNVTPSDRPTFCEIRLRLDDLLSHHRNYLDLDCLGHPRSSRTPPIPEVYSVDVDNKDSVYNNSHLIAASASSNNLREESNSISVGGNPWDFREKEEEEEDRWNTEDFGYLQSRDVPQDEKLETDENEDETLSIHLSLL